MGSFNLFNQMKFAILALIGLVAAKQCRTDGVCSSNWVKKKCCSDFECNAYCDTTRCRTNTCCGIKCAKKASDFHTTMFSRPPTVMRDAYGRIIPTNVPTPAGGICKFSTSGP